MGAVRYLVAWDVRRGTIMGRTEPKGGIVAFDRLVRQVMIDYSDRSEVQRVSGQGLVPVIDDDGTVVVDSMEIVRYLEDWRRTTDGSRATRSLHRQGLQHRGSTKSGAARNLPKSRSRSEAAVSWQPSRATKTTLSDTLPRVRRMRELLSSERVWLGLVVLGALALRLIDAGSRLNHGEGYSWLVASAPDAGAFLSRLARFENTPPLFYVLLAPLPLDHELWLRLPSILAGTALIPVLYAIVRPLLGSGAALLAAVGLAVAPFAVSYSDYSRGFMLAGLGLLVALLAAQRLALGGSRRWWAVYTLAATGALYSEYYAALSLKGWCEDRCEAPAARGRHDQRVERRHECRRAGEHERPGLAGLARRTVGAGVGMHEMPPSGGFAAHGGLIHPTRHTKCFGHPQGSECAQRLSPPLELSAFDTIGGQRDCPLVCGLCRDRLTRASKQLGVRGVKRLVALEARVGE